MKVINDEFHCYSSNNLSFSGYYFTNVSCALQFVQNMNAESLKMPREEFEAYTSGHQVPPLNAMNMGCNQVLYAFVFNEK